MQKHEEDLARMVTPKVTRDDSRTASTGAPESSAGAGDGFSLRAMAEHVVRRFRQDEADGYRSRDRQYVIELLGKALEVDGWRDIASAPKEDMASVIGHLNGETRTTHWDSAYGRGGAWICDLPYQQSRGGFAWKPTHWMPLPAPPETT